MLASIKERIWRARHKTKLSDLHRVIRVYSFVFLVWGLYRLLFRLPVEIEEMVLKFLVFGAPVFYVVLKVEKKSLESLGMVTDGLMASLYFGLLFGLWLAVFANILRFLQTGGLAMATEITVQEFGQVAMLGLVTALWEELLFMGYMLPRMVKDLGSEWLGVGMVAGLFVLIHLPSMLANGVGIDQVVVRSILLFTLGFGNGVLYLRFKNLAAPIFSHLAWGSVIFLFG